MASRERKRNERRKRKQRRTEKSDQGRTLVAEEAGVPNGNTDFVERYRSSTEAKNEAARRELEPLATGERPRVVTVAALVAALISASIVVAYAIGLEVDGERPALLQVAAPASLMAIMALGMWRARYWAVLGFQVLLVILLVSSAIGLSQATTARQVVGNVVVIAGAGTFFWFMVKALARIQMPSTR